MISLLQIETFGVVIAGFILIIEEARRLGKVITPLTLMVTPFLVILFLMNIVLIHFNYPTVTEKVMLFLLIQFIIFWVIGYIIFEIFNRPPRLHFDFSEVECQLVKFTPVIVGLAILSAFIIIQKALALFQAHGGITYYAHPKYEKFMNRGASAHFIQLAKVCMFLLIVVYRRYHPKWLLWGVFGLLMVALALVQVKYHILHMMLMGLLYFSLNKNIKGQLRTLIGSALLLIIIFNIFWYIIAQSAGITDTRVLQKAVLRYSVNYLASGTISLDIWMAHANVMPEWAPLVTIKNVINAILSNPYRHNLVRVVSLDFMDVGAGLITNVGTAYGPFYLIGGWPLSWAFTVVTGLLYYSLYFLSARYKNAFLLFLNLLMLVFSTFTFFVQYFLLLSTMEMPILLLILLSVFSMWNLTERLILKAEP